MLNSRCLHEEQYCSHLIHLTWPTFLFFQLEPHKNLVDQCVKGEGLVQINVEIKYIIKRINILDVLKPTEDALGNLVFPIYNRYDCTNDFCLF